MPQRGSPDQRPRGLPTHADRARQTLLRHALAPAWDATRAPHTAGLRPGRAWGDALETLFQRMVLRPQDALQGESAQGFDRRPPATLVPTRPGAPGLRRQGNAWRPAGRREPERRVPPRAGPPPGGTRAPVRALLARHGMDKARTAVAPPAQVIASADAGVGRHEDRHVREPGQPGCLAGLAGVGRTLHEATRRRCHPVAGAQPGGAWLGVHLRQERVGSPHAGTRPGGPRLGCNPLSQPAQANSQAQLAARGRMSQRAQAGPPRGLLRQRNPPRRGGASADRPWVSPAVSGRLEPLRWGTLRRWASRRHPMQAVAWAMQRAWPQRAPRLACATPATDPDAVALRTHSAGAMTRQSTGRGTRSPYDGAGGEGSPRRGGPPRVSPRLATGRKRPQGRCPSCGVCVHHEAGMEMDPMHGERGKARARNLQALHGHCHEAHTRAPRASRPPGKRDKPQDTEERRDANVSCAVLEQRSAERSAYRL